MHGLRKGDQLRDGDKLLQDEKKRDQREWEHANQWQLQDTIHFAFQFSEFLHLRIKRVFNSCSYICVYVYIYISKLNV